MAPPNFSNKIKQLIHQTAEAIKLLRLENQSGDGVTTRAQKRLQAESTQVIFSVLTCG
jgi:hypothetical protein